MAYIGTKPTVGNFQICDAISVVNGQAAYTMQVGSVNVIPQSANHMIVSLNGTIQKPNRSYTVSGSTITFASNLATGDVIDFIQILGDVLDLGVPSDATVTTAKLASDSVTYEKIGYNANQYRNIIINGDMSIAQRGTSFTSLAGVSQYNLDRWETIGVNVGSGRYQINQSTDTPTGFTYSQKISCTTAEASQDVNNQLYLEQQIEGLNSSYLNYYVASPDTVTLSFWVKSNLTGSYSVALKLSDNGSAINSGSTRIYPTTYSISSANTWEKKTVTITLDSATTETKVVNNGFAVATQFWLGAGTSRDGETTNAWKNNANAAATSDNLNLLGSTSNEWYITGIQLEAGTTASDFEFLPHDVNLNRCYRYCYRVNGNSTDEQQSGVVGWSTANNTLNAMMRFVPELRTSPTVTESDMNQTTTGTAISLTGVFDDNDTSDCNAIGLSFSADSGTPFTTGNVMFPRVNSSTSAFIQFDSEL